MSTVHNTGNNTLNRVTNLLNTDLKKILKKEMHNNDRINLYDVGEYWVAFEKSAYMLERMADDGEMPMVLYLNSHPFPIVMRSIHYLKVNDMCKKHIMAKRQLEYLQFLTQQTDDISYSKWYREFVIDEN